MDGFYVGDVIGNSYTHENSQFNLKVKDFDLFTERSKFSDDTILTFATMDWLLHTNQSAEAMFFTLKKFYEMYPDHNPTIYGNSFVSWIENSKGENRSSVGNGGAMRAGVIGFYAKTLDQLTELVFESMKVTHNSEEGLKSSLIVARAIFELKNGMSKQDLKKLIENEYNFNLSFDYESYWRSYNYDLPNAYETVRPAIVSFLFSKNFVDAIRNAVSFGGDTDTLTTITANLAEAYYKKIPKGIVKRARTYLNSHFKSLLNEFKQECE